MLIGAMVVMVVAVVALILIDTSSERKRNATSVYWHTLEHSRNVSFAGYVTKKGLKMLQVDRSNLEDIESALEDAEEGLMSAADRCKEALEDVQSAQKDLDAILYPKAPSKWEV